MSNILKTYIHLEESQEWCAVVEARSSGAKGSCNLSHYLNFDLILKINWQGRDWLLEE